MGLLLAKAISDAAKDIVVAIEDLKEEVEDARKPFELWLHSHDNDATRRAEP